MLSRGCSFQIAAAVIGFVLSPGCGPSVRVIEGQVTLDGKPLESGSIEFEPTDKRSRLFGGDIRSGRYRVEMVQHEAVGTSTIRIISPQPTGRKIPAGPPALPGATVDEIADVVPLRYNSESILKVDLSSSGSYDFELSTKH